MSCLFEKLAREHVPKPPSDVLNGVVDDGPHRWRFKNGELINYLFYGPGTPPGWTAAWHKPVSGSAAP